MPHLEKMVAPNAPFYIALEKHLGGRGIDVTRLYEGDKIVAQRILEAYGAMFIACDEVMLPPVCLFSDEEAVERFQRAAKFAAAEINGAQIELQPAALHALLAARAEAHARDLDITPRGGTEAARRHYGDTLRLWRSRVLPALTHWTNSQRISAEEAARLRDLPIVEQVAAVLQLEDRGIFFSKDFSKSILYSVAAPGASQHLAMLAFDVAEFMDARVREILARHGWFQTVLSDLPHFTFLGVKESDLPARGLHSVKAGEQIFWIPNIAPVA
jgi:hypothetical protein